MGAERVTLRVFVVDSRPAVLAALAGALGRQPGLRVVGTAGTAEAAYAALTGGAPPVDVAVVEARLPGASGVELCRRLADARPEVRCVVLSAAGDPAHARAALAAGAAAYLVKDLSTGELVTAVRNAGRGERYADARVTREAPRAVGVTALSPAERTVLRLVAEGLTDAEIGTRIDDAPTTAGARVARLLLKLGVRTRAEAASLALRDAAL